MNFNVPVTSAFEVPVDDLRNMAEIHEVLSTEIVDAAVEGISSSVLRSDGGWNAEDLGGPKFRLNDAVETMKSVRSRKKSKINVRSLARPPDRYAAIDKETKEETRSSPRSSSATLPTGQRVHILSDVEVNDLRQRLSTRVASLRHDKREKEEKLQKKKRIQELQAELARLNDLEVQLKEYEQQPLESLQEELQIHQQEIADLAKKLEQAVQEELEWVWQTSTFTVTLYLYMCLILSMACTEEKVALVPCIRYCK
ncbi:hypothetical protein V7S43_000724 [Phytophthora oleae]|uniref:Uncharacterized protein n=1 Tax=Phytophthora oleae TaxID=2107226 RepID=A0ABD3G7Y5_9STRA